MSLPALVAYKGGKSNADGPRSQILTLLIVETWTNIQWLFVACVGVIVFPFLPSLSVMWVSVGAFLGWGDYPEFMHVAALFKVGPSVFFFLVVVHRSRMLVTQSLSNLLALIAVSRSP